jgi:iron complex transport system permease protein
VGFGASALAAAGLGAAGIPWVEVPRALADPGHPAHALLWTIRMPRIGAAIVVGAALALSGALLQAAVRNPLADPLLMGVTAGAGLGGLIAILFVPSERFAIPVLAFLGGLTAIAAVLGLASTGRGLGGPLRIVLSGVAVQAIRFSAVALRAYAFAARAPAGVAGLLVSAVALLTSAFADRAPAFVAFTLGSLAGVGWPDVALGVVPVAIAAVLAILSARSLNLLLLDDASAGGVGLAVERTRFGASCLAALLAAGAASVAGLVGFVGLVVPNWVRILIGPDHRLLLPLATLAGATLVIVADTAARTVAAPLELPVGALLALVGGPYFLFVLWRRLG